MSRPRSINLLVESLQNLPGVGPKSAQRMAESIIAMNYDDAREMARAILRVKKNIIRCSTCGVHSESDPCSICADPERDKSKICVVQSLADVEAFERAKVHDGVYHVLGGLINLVRGVGPEKLNLPQLADRVAKGGVAEVLIAVDTSMDGETTAAYIIKYLKNTGVRLSRPAQGIPMGADLDYLDSKTLRRACDSREELFSKEE